MKKTLLCFFLVCVIALSGFTVSAAEADTTEEPVTILELLQTKRGKIDALLDSLTFDESMDRVDISTPMIFVHVWDPNLFIDGLSFEEVLACVDEENCKFALVVCSENPQWLSITKGEQSISLSKSLPRINVVIENEFLNATVHQTFLGEECQILDIHFFTNVFFGTTVIFQTDKGDFVRFYHYFEPWKSERQLELTWEDYAEYACAYRKYELEMIKEFGYSKCDFIMFVEEYKAQKEAQRQAELAAQTRKWLLISVTGVVVLGAATATILTLRRKRKNATAQ